MEGEEANWMGFPWILINGSWWVTVSMLLLFRNISCCVQGIYSLWLKQLHLCVCLSRQITPGMKSLGWGEVGVAITWDQQRQTKPVEKNLFNPFLPHCSVKVYVCVEISFHCLYSTLNQYQSSPASVFYLSSWQKVKVVPYRLAAGCCLVDVQPCKVSIRCLIFTLFQFTPPIPGSPGRLTEMESCSRAWVTGCYGGLVGCEVAAMRRENTEGE